MALALAHALTELSEATVATLPGSVGNTQGRRLTASLTKDVRKYFAALQRRFPTRKVLAFAKKFMDARPEDFKQTQAGKQKVARQVEKIIAPGIGASDAALERALAEHSSVGYMVAAGQIEASLRKSFRVRESVLSEASLRAEFVDEAIPIEVIDWARDNAATEVTQMAATTQRDLANTIAEAMTQPARGVPDVAREIQNRFSTMSQTRSELIATTEMNDAMSQGTFDRGVSMGAREKDWITVGDGDVDKKVCRPNGGQGKVAISRTFGSGHMRPPGHPRCRCALATFGATSATIRAGVSEPGRSNWLRHVGEGLATARGLNAIVQAAAG